eukprot:TRINITY_DN819_c0_g1_i12.p1 TRINITY_DN819_c0_g1~~TRINITY_DN819_c0_g1_i12.p1  ORF type:complete len:406 (+),score=83.59 TRINITY_DN819_c0_g1_i12:144-1361(+)
MKSSIAKAREDKCNELKEKLNAFVEKIKKLTEMPESFITQEEQLVASELLHVDTQVAHLVSQLVVLFLNKLQVARSHLSYANEDIGVMRQSLEVTKRILTFSSYLSFETYGKISLRQLSRVPGQFSRCQKAVITNLKAGVIRESAFEEVEVIEAFKLENAVLLEKFEGQKKLLRGRGVLKGLFMVINEKQMFSLVLYGMNKKYSLASVSQIPRTLKQSVYGEAEERINETLKESSSELGLPLYMSNHSVNEEIIDRLQDKNSSQLLILTLCRAIIPQEKNEEVFYSKLKDLYEIHNPDLVFPEYIFLCKLAKPAILKNNTLESTKALQQEIKEMEVEEAKVVEAIKSIYEQFWMNISTKVQKKIHPKVIAARSFVINELKQQIEEQKAWINDISSASHELELILN